MTVKALRNTYQLKITLVDAKPPIWRRVLVPSHFDLGAIHRVIQIAMGWETYHLHQFIADGVYYAQPDEDALDMGFETEDENKYKLSQLLKKEKDKINYEYDFGDGWIHKIELEKILPYDPKATLPLCVTGKRACPPEDCGGVWGYEQLLETLADSDHPDHQDMLDWLGGEFDPTYFDKEEINAELAKAF
jgi:hypothetical protein